MTDPVPELVVDPVPPLLTGKAVPEYPIAKVPLLVKGDPVMLRKLGTDNPIEVIKFAHVIVPVPCDTRACPVVPAVVGKLKL
jgi:hypothetical protein